MWAGVVAWVTKWAVLLAIGALLIAGAIGWWVWHNHEIAKNAAAIPKAQVQVDKAKIDSAKEAVGVVEENGKKSAATDDTTRKNNVIILKVPGAKVDLDPALDAAGRAALCVHNAYANLPECQQLQRSGPK